MSVTQNWVNPIGKGLSPERIDMGVDYGGSGQLFALGSGTVTNLHNSGWPGGNFLTIHLDSGQYIYYAEDIQPLVSVGQKVTAGQHIANATGGSNGIEVGWAAPPGTGETMAASLGQQSHTGDPGSVSTAFGNLMSEVISKLGGPAGKSQGAVSGSIPSNFGVSPGNVTTAPGTQQATLLSTTSATLPAGSGGILSFPDQIVTFFKDANLVVKPLVWLIEPGSWIRIVAFIAGVALLLLALYAFLQIAEGGESITPSAPKPVPVPI